MEAVKYALGAAIGLASGVVISGAVFAFITVLGVVPRLAQKTRTPRHVRLYESAIALGGIAGTLLGAFMPHIPIGGAAVAAMSLCVGVFYGCLAMSLAEVLKVIPILSRRGRIQKGMFFFVLAIALGKMTGSLLYFLQPGFFNAGGM